MNDKELRKYIEKARERGYIQTFAEVARAVKMKNVRSIYLWYEGYYNLGYKRKKEVVNYLLQKGYDFNDD